MKINHIGYAVKSINESIKMFELLGFDVVEKPIEDKKRNIEIVFMKNDATVIELISPLNDDSPIGNILKKMGNTPYHLCFEVSDLDKKVLELKKYGFVPIGNKDKALAFCNKDIVFLYNKAVGIIELVEC